MATDQEKLENAIRVKAAGGDGAFAIAYAIIQLADAQSATAKAIHKLGVAGASTPFGAIEALGMQLKEAAELIAGAVSEATNRDQQT